MSDNFAASMVHYACPVCGKEMDWQIVVNNKFNKKTADKVRELHNQCIGYSDHVCEECSKYKNDVVFIIGVNPDKSDFKSINTIYRTGQIAGIKKDCEFVNHLSDFIITLNDDTQICFMDEQEGKQLNLWNNETD